MKCLEVWVKILRARDDVEALGAMISKIGLAKPNQKLTY